MSKTKFQEIIFTIMMVFMMVYFMICYNIALNVGGMTNQVFLDAFHELVIMGPVAFILDFVIVDLENNHPFHLVIAISVVSIILMCPCMSFAATLLFKNAGSQIIAVWLQTTVLNFPMAFFLQLCFAGPIVRFVFGQIFRENRA